MCDKFWERMEKSQGDLTDIFQGSGLAVAGSATAAHTWQPSPDQEADGFSDELDDTKDLMLHELAGTGFFGSTEKRVANTSLSSMAVTVIRQPSPQLVGLACTEKVCGGVPMPLTRTSVIKGRKNQAKKVVCIPAPALASNKPGGEIVPSDLWAWRKYGQKPIKGSPYPRGYYRCSSSKGCPARKQVERSRTDPNMLVITYTSDHNHPWPTQKTGSARSQYSSKNNNNNASSSNQKPPTENITTNSIYELEGDDFLADLAIIDADLLSLDEENKAIMDPINMVCWDGRNSLGLTKGS